MHARELLQRQSAHDVVNGTPLVRTLCIATVPLGLRGSQLLHHLPNDPARAVTTATREWGGQRHIVSRLPSFAAAHH